MTDEVQSRRRKRVRLVLALALLALLLAVALLPPMINIGRYKGRVAGLISASLGRPARISSVELRLLPRPGFVLTDLTVDEDPAYGAEPVLYANTVTASIRLSSLWRGVEISSISLDDASLNLVRTPAGRWNVESLFRTAAQPGSRSSGTRRRPLPLPYFEATESRINFKNGVEKLPYSLIGADASFWQEQPGEWRIRLRGQPARTDLSLQLGDTGVLRLDADLRRAAELRQVPMRVDAEWRDAQLGQLTRLLLGTDPGWRGALTGEFHMKGTPDAAQISTRLRAEGVHRAEFAPAEPMDFDAACAFVFHYPSWSAEGLECNSPLGDGRIRLTGALPGDGAKPMFSVELDRLPVAAALDALRTVRSGLGEGIEARGTISGRIDYAEVLAKPAEPVRASRRRAAKLREPAPGPLTGSFTVQGFEISGGGLKQPVRLNRMLLEPGAASFDQAGSATQGLVATATVPAGATAPLTVTSRLTLSGYQVSVRGQASIARVRELAQLAGTDDQAALSALTGDPAAVDLTVEGPWIAPEPIPLQSDGDDASSPGPDRLAGTLAFRNAAWKASFLANPIQLSQATLHLDGGGVRWDPVAFSYGTEKGTATLNLPGRCQRPEGCPPEFELHFGALEGGALEAAILGAHEPGTLFSELVARLNPSRPPEWPKLEGTIHAVSLAIGPVTLEQPSANLRIVADGAEITGFDAVLLGGHMHGTGTVRAGGAQGDSTGKPAYTLQADFEHLEPAALGRLLGQRWMGGEIEGSGKVEISGYSAQDFAASAAGNLEFAWKHGAILAASESADPGGTSDAPLVAVPSPLTRFDSWTGNATVAKGTITLGENQVQRGARRFAVAAEVNFGAPPTLVFNPAREPQTAQR
jgi:hypothetical protein